jgi:hypothetical protein
MPSRALSHGKVIAKSMQQLPYIDEHSQQIEAPVDAVWAALLKVLRQMNVAVRWRGFWAAIPRKALPVSPAALTRQCPFRVLEAEHGRRLVLRGRHRFSNYALIFVLDGHRLRAQTRAAYPGILGCIYRAAVIRQRRPPVRDAAPICGGSCGR